MTGSNGLHSNVFQFLFGRINYERQSDVPYQEDRFRLLTMRRLLEALGNPQDDYPIIHIAGTKGKGSTASMIAAILTDARLRAGVYSSPHLHQLEERFCIGSTPCDTDDLADLLQEIRTAVEEIDRQVDSSKGLLTRPTFFEITTAAAMLYFSRQQVDCAVLEVGLGGRLDATNVCRPVLTVITSISLDHTRQLGSTLECIAAEKAGIVKDGIPLVSGVVEPGPAEVIDQIANDRAAPLIKLGQQFTYSVTAGSAAATSVTGNSVTGNSVTGNSVTGNSVTGNSVTGGTTAKAGSEATVGRESHDSANRSCAGELIYTTDRDGASHRLGPFEVGLAGLHQRHNAALAVSAVEYLRSDACGWPVFEQIDDRSIARGLRNVRSLGRIELVSESPRIFCDMAHNVASVEALIETLEKEQATRRVLLFATSRDKDARGMLALLLKRFDHCILTRFESNPRSTDPVRLQYFIDELKSGGSTSSFGSTEICHDPQVALSRFRERLDRDAIGCIAGSAFIVAELRKVIVGDRLETQDTDTAGVSGA